MIDKTNPPRPFCVDEFEHGWQAFACIARLADDQNPGGGECTPDPPTDAPEIYHATREQAVEASHRYAAALAAPRIQDFAERVAAWWFGPGESRRRAWHAWVAYVDSGGTLGLDAWAATAITEAARTNGRLPGEEVADGEAV